MRSTAHPRAAPRIDPPEPTAPAPRARGTWRSNQRQEPRRTTILHMQATWWGKVSQSVGLVLLREHVILKRGRSSNRCRRRSGLDQHRPAERTMEHGLSWNVGWQLVLPLTMCMITLVMVKWYSHHSARSTARRTARVVSKLGPARRGSEVFRR